MQSLVEWVKEHEEYNSELQEVEKWLLQMSSRLVTSDSMQTGNMEMATQQLARHKVIISIACHVPVSLHIPNAYLDILIELFHWCQYFLGHDGGNSQF